MISTNEDFHSILDSLTVCGYLNIYKSLNLKPKLHSTMELVKSVIFTDEYEW